MGARASESDRARYSQMSRVENFRPIQEVRGQSSSVQRSNAAPNAARAERACPQGWAHLSQEPPAQWPTHSDAPRRSDMSYPRHSPCRWRKVRVAPRFDENAPRQASAPIAEASPPSWRRYASGSTCGASSLNRVGRATARHPKVPISKSRVKAPYKVSV
jgi:hypothetical protein